MFRQAAGPLLVGFDVGRQRDLSVITVVEDLKYMTRFPRVEQKIALESDIKSYYDNYTNESFQEFMDNISVAAEEQTSGEEAKVEVVEESNLEKALGRISGRSKKPEYYRREELKRQQKVGL